MVILATIVVLIILALMFFAIRMLEPIEADTEEPKAADTKTVRRCKWIAQVVLIVLLLNSVSFSVCRGLNAVRYKPAKPTLVTLYDAGTYQTDEVHYLIAGVETRPEDIQAILPDGLTGTVKAVKYRQFSYNTDAIAGALDDDMRRYNYTKATIWAVGMGAVATSGFGALTSKVRDNAQIVLIDPCPNTLVLNPERWETMKVAAPWQRALSYLMGWASLIPGKDGHSINLSSMMMYELDYETEAYTLNPHTENVIGVVISAQNQYLQTGALKGLYKDAFQVSVTATHSDIVDSDDLYREALEEIWTRHTAKIEQAEAEDYTGPLPSDPT